jgi:hypothetical protein
VRGAFFAALKDSLLFVRADDSDNVVQMADVQTFCVNQKLSTVKKSISGSKSRLNMKDIWSVIASVNFPF